MSVSNPFSINGSWKIDPDGRQDRSSGLCTTRKMTEDEKIKYGIAVESEDDVEMAHMTKDIVRKMASEGMNTAEIAEHFMPAYPKMKKSMMMAKVTMLLEGKKRDRPAKEKTMSGSDLPPVKTAEDISAINGHEDHPAKDVSRAVQENIKKMMLEMVPDEKINHPVHYTAGSIEVIDYLQDKMPAEMFEGFCIGNALKYLSRYRHKGGLEDLKKAEWYLNKIITVMETA